MSLVMHDGEFLTAYHADATIAGGVPALVVGDRVTFDLIAKEPILRSVLPPDLLVAVLVFAAFPLGGACSRSRWRGACPSSAATARPRAAGGSRAGRC